MSNAVTAKQIQDFKQLNSLDFFARQVVEGFLTGLHKSPFHGFSVEFAEHRLYNAGESTKHVDWKLYGKTDKLFVKRYQEETNLRCQILIDISPSMLFPLDKSVNKLTFSAYAAASLAYLLNKQRDAIGLTLFDSTIKTHIEPKISKSHIMSLFALLDKQINTKFSDNLNNNTHITDVLHNISEVMKKRSLVVLFSDMFENKDDKELFQAIEHLRYNKHEVIIFHIYDDELENKFAYENRPYKFIDMETGEKLRLNPQHVRKEYNKQINEYFNSIKNKCLQYKTDFVPSNINQPFDQMLLSFLAKRKHMF